MFQINFFFFICSTDGYAESNINVNQLNDPLLSEMNNCAKTNLVEERLVSAMKNLKADTDQQKHGRRTF